MDTIDQESQVRLSLYIKAGQLEAAERFIRSLLSEKPNDAKLFNQLALVKFSDGLFSDAIIAWQQAVEIDPTLYTSVYSLAILCCDLGYYKEAEKLIVDYQKHQESSRLTNIGTQIIIDAYLKNAEYYLTNQNYNEATAEVFRALKLDEKNKKSHLLLGKIYFQQQKWQEALKAFEAAAQYNPDSCDTLNWLAIAYMRNGRKQVAVNYWEKVLTIDPQNLVASSYLKLIQPF